MEDFIPTFVVCVDAVIRKKDKFLLVRRSDSDPQEGGKWSFPGGKIEQELTSDILERSLAREVKEETGLKIENHIDLIDNGSFVRVSGHFVIMLTFLCYYKSGVARPLEDHSEVKWLSLKEIDQMWEKLPVYTQAKITALKKFLQKHPGEKF